MKKESYSFKILTKPNTVKQDDEYLDYKANKKDGPTVGVDEALSREGRRKLAQSAKINAKRNAIARDKAAKKKASPEKLQQRAQKKAREMLKNKLLKGKSINDISMADRERLEAKLDNMTAKIQKIAKKLLPDLKKAEEERLQQMRSNESVKLGEAKESTVKKEIWMKSWKPLVSKIEALDAYEDRSMSHISRDGYLVPVMVIKLDNLKDSKASINVLKKILSDNDDWKIDSIFGPHDPKRRLVSYVEIVYIPKYK
jgi:hypothetical protein